MHVTLTAKRQVTFPASVLAELRVAPGDKLEIIRGADGFLIRPKRVDVSRLGSLRKTLGADAVAFDIETFRNQAYDAKLRD